MKYLIDMVSILNSHRHAQMDKDIEYILQNQSNSKRINERTNFEKLSVFILMSSFNDCLKCSTLHGEGV